MKTSEYSPSNDRYANMVYRKCGNSGISLPALSLGLWHNFGGVDNFENGRSIIRSAFDAGITHFDLANNYGPPYGSAEENFGRILKLDLSPYRDELIISSKAGYDTICGRDHTAMVVRANTSLQAAIKVLNDWELIM